MTNKVRPFILRNRCKLPAEPPPETSDAYDLRRQVWIDKLSGEPVVTRHAKLTASTFGETTITKTSEGHDQIESLGSTFGETTHTRTSEGADQLESPRGIGISQFGETLITATAEGVDRSETQSSLAASQFGETLLTETGEGSDRPERSDTTSSARKTLISDGNFVYIKQQ